MTLQEAGVSTINLNYANSTKVDAQGNAHKQVGSFTTTGGATRAAVDVWFEANATESVATTWVAVPEDIALLPNVQGYGKVRDLHQSMAMDSAGQLKGLVTSFVQATSVEQRNALVVEIIYRWTGVQNVNPTSRAATRIYGNAIGDARKLEALEEFMGEEWVGTWCWGESDPNPHGPAATVLLAAFSQFSELIYSTLASQTFLKPMYEKIAYLWDGDEQTVVGDLQGVATVVANAVAANRSAGKEQLSEFVRSLNGLGIEQHVDMTTFAAALLPLGGDVVSIVDKSISPNATERADNLYGTNNADIVTGLAGNDQIRGLDGADTLDGGDGNDALYGQGGNDEMSGGRGDDSLYGDVGIDTYLFARGDGKDSLHDDYQQDCIINLSDLSVDELVFSRSGANLVVTFATSAADRMTLADFFKNGEPAGNVVLRQANGVERVLDAASLIQLTLVATSNADVLGGSSQADTINGLGGDDLILARAGNDLIDGGAGNDHINGAEGVDDLSGGVGNDVLYGESGADTLRGGADHDRLYGGIDNDTLYGDSGDDVLDGESGADSLIGGAGNDTYFVDNAGDVIAELAGEGLDVVNATASVVLTANVENAVLTGEANITATGNGAANQITGNVGANVISGLGGDDVLRGDAGNDQVNGGDGFDHLYGGVGQDTLDGGTQDDRLYGDAQNDLLHGGSGSDLLEGGEGNDTLWGGADDDLLDGGTGADSMAAGQGSDAYIVDDAGDIITELVNEGVDTVTTSVSLILSANVENVLLVGAGSVSATGNTEANEMVGNNADNELKGLGGHDKLRGEGGEDTLEGGSGNDTLDGGAGIDMLTGGSGDDAYHLDNLGDVVLEGLNEGSDTVFAQTDHLLSAHVENLVLKAEGGYINGTGNALANKLTGNYYGNRLDGGAGVDTLEGLGGDDTYVVDTLADQIIEQGGGGRDTVETHLTYTLGVQLEGLTLTGTADVSGYGNDLENRLIGNLGNNRLEGGNGYDRLDGGGGHDTLDGGTGPDNMYGGRGDDIYIANEQGDGIVEYVNEGTDTVERYFESLQSLNANVENLALKGTVYRGNGNGLNNVISGNESDNNLSGQDGNDTIFGGGGMDALFGGSGFDVLVGGIGDDYYEIDNVDDFIIEQLNEGDDIVRSTVSWSLGAHLERLAVDGDADLTVTGNGLGNGLWGNNGHNVITGGRGDDYIEGGRGNDTYVFNKGDGHDSIDTDDLTSAVDTLKLNVLDTDVTVTRSDDDLLVRLKGVDDYIFIIGHFAPVRSVNGQTLDKKLDRIEFANGVEWDQSIIATKVNLEATNEPPSVNAFPSGQTARRGTWFSYVVPQNTITDPDVGDSIKFSMSLENGGALPSWLSFDPQSRTLSGSVPLNEATGTTQLVLWGEDNFGYSAGVYVNLTVATANVVAGTTGNADTLNGTSGSDVLNGGDGNDQLSGQGGNDRLDGGAGADVMNGGAGDDIYVVGVAGDQVNETVGAGNDLVETSISLGLAPNVERAILTGTVAGTLTGNELANILTGNGVANTLNGGLGADTLIGGGGDDIYVVDSTLDIVVERQGQGRDQVNSSVDTVLADHVEDLTLVDLALNGAGNSVDNVIMGNALNNRLEGRDGTDTLNGGGGQDTLIGGDGNDLFAIDSADDSVIELIGEGRDTVESSVSYQLSSAANSEVESLILVGSENLNATGNRLNNFLQGNVGNNVLDGLGGWDTLSGEGGNDVYYVDDIRDVVIEQAQGGFDEVYTSVTYQVDDQIEYVELTGAASVHLTGGNNGVQLWGNGGSNQITGGSGADELSGGFGGADTLKGGQGDDRYISMNAADLVVEQEDEGFDEVWSFTDGYRLAEHAESLLLLSSTRAGYGNSGDNLLTGNGAVNALYGEGGDDILAANGGNDTLVGGLGDDMLVGGKGNDTYIYNVGDGWDFVNNNDASGYDTLLMQGVTESQLWFTVYGSGLSITAIGREGELYVGSWTRGSAYQLDAIRLDNGKVLTAANVGNLVSAMAAFTPPAPGQTTLPAAYETALGGVIAANWTA